MILDSLRSEGTRQIEENRKSKRRTCIPQVRNKVDHFSIAIMDTSSNFNREIRGSSSETYSPHKFVKSRQQKGKL